MGICSVPEVAVGVAAKAGRVRSAIVRLSAVNQPKILVYAGIMIAMVTMRIIVGRLAPGMSRETNRPEGWGDEPHWSTG